MTTNSPRPYRLPRRRHFVIEVPDLGPFSRGHDTHVWAENELDALKIFNGRAKFMCGLLQVEDVRKGNPFVK